MDELMDDIFGESTTPTEEQGKKKPDSHRERRESDVDDLFNLSVAPEKSSTTQSSRRDSELDDLFSSIGLNDDSAPPKRNASSDSLDDVDAFISNLTGSSPPHSGAETSELNLGHIEKDDFLSWLEEPENSKPQQGQENLSTPAGPINTKGDRESEKSTQREVEEEYEEEEEEEEDHFYIDHTGTTVIQDEQAGQESESSAMDDQQPREQVQELTLPFPVLRPVTDGVSEAIVPRSLQQLQATDAECTGQNISASVEKVSVRVETLFEIEQFDVQALRSASYFKDVAGFVVPPQLRPDMWSAITRNSRLEQQLVPDWFQVPEERLAEVFPSIRKTIRKDCRDAWAALSSQTDVSLENDTVNQLHILVSKLVLRHREKTYNILLTNVASVVVWMVSRSVKESTEQVFSTSAKLIESVCAKWGGRSGDWSFMGLRKDSIAIGVGGAAWTNETLPLVAFRRHLILSKLVAFHDAALGYHLESFCKNWSCSELTVFLEDDATPPPMLDPESNEPQATVFQRRVVDRVIEMATKTPRWPSGKLFGPLSPVPATGTLTDLNGEHLLALWDAVFFSGRTPQTMAFFFALASLLLTRNNLLQTRESAAISRHIENAYQGSVLQADSTRPASSLAALAVSLVSNTPDCLLNWISEEELLLPLASEEQLADFEAMRRRAKDAEQEILRVLADKEKAESVQQRNDPPKEQPEEGSDEKVEFEAPVDDADHPQQQQQQQPQPRTAQATSSAQQSRTSWFSSALKKRAQTIKSAILTASGTNTIDWSKFHLVRKLVEFGGSEEEPLGLSMRKGKYGLEVEAVVPGGVTERTQLVSSGDLVMTLNGLLVFGLSGAEVEALLSQQERPFYMVFGTLLPKDVPLGSEIESLLHAPTLCPGLLERVEAYYTVYNKGKEKEVERILSLYSHREAVLLEELALKYMDHVEGDPFYFPQSLFCPPMDPHEVVRQVCFKEEEHSPNAEHYRAHRQGTSAWSTSHKQTSSEAPRKLFLVDCRPAKTVEKTGRFPTCYTLDPVLLDDEEERKKLHQVFEPMRGDMQICILGSGSDTLLSDINPKRSRVLRERDRRGIDTVALYFLRLGFPFVSYVEGGFLGCFLAIREMEYSLDDCLVNMPPSRQFLAKYDAFIRYRKSSSSSAAAFLASKARSGMTKPRTETAASFSGLLASGDDESGSRTKNLAAIGSYLSNVWKQPQSQSQPQSMHDAVEHHQEQQTEHPKQTTSDPSPGGGETMNKASAFFSSVWKKTSAAKAPEKEGGGEETTSASQDEDGSSTTLRKHDSTDSTGQGGTSWTSSLSSRFKSLKVPDTANLGSKLRTAYVSAQQKLATVSTTDGSVTSASYSLDLDETPEILAKIDSLQKGEKVHLRELEQSIRAFQVQKEKPDIQNDKETEIKTVPRLLVISPERFLVLEPVEGVENEGVVKSNRPLRDVARMRYPNNDPSKISLFYNKSPGSDQVSYIYRFPTEAKTFTKSIMHACAKNNSKRAAQQENT